MLPRDGLSRRIQRVVKAQLQMSSHPEEQVDEPLPIYPSSNKRRATRQRSRSLPRLSNPFTRVVEEEIPEKSVPDPRVHSANQMVEVFGGLSKQLEALLKNQQEQQSLWERRSTQESERFETLLSNIRIGSSLHGGERAHMASAPDTPGDQPLTLDKVRDEVRKIKDLLDDYVVELKVTWYWTGETPVCAQTWRGVAHTTGDETDSIIVTYPHGTSELPLPGVTYTKIEVVGKTPIDSVTQDSVEEKEFVLHDVSTWESLLVPQKDYDVLENRLRVGLRMPTTLTPELQYVWDLFHQWVLLTQGKGGLNLADKKHLKMGQMLLDRLRIKQAILRGADPQYVETHYGVQQDPTDQLGNMLVSSINYNKTRGRAGGHRGRRAYYGRGTQEQNSKVPRSDFALRGSGGK